jgi:hypothetical protein
LLGRAFALRFTTATSLAHELVKNNQMRISAISRQHLAILEEPCSATCLNNACSFVTAAMLRPISISSIDGLPISAAHYQQHRLEHGCPVYGN